MDNEIPVPLGLPTPDEMQAAYRVLRWLTFNYLVPATDTWTGMVEGTRCLCVCAHELFLAQDAIPADYLKWLSDRESA